MSTKIGPPGPLRFQPILRRLVWGGRRLGTILHKAIGPENDYAESWEIADYRDQVSTIAEGPLAGTTLRELVQTRAAELFGADRAPGPGAPFPLLVKFIDAREALSVQVHPDDERGRRLANDSGKTEAWVVLAAEPGSEIYAGLAPGVDRATFEAAIRDGAVGPLLHRFPARPGDSILIEAGTVHAIGAGVLLAEIQQMSDATFRVFDWNRVGSDGRPRALHVREALESIDFERGPVHPVQPRATEIPGAGTREELAQSKYFAFERLTLNGPGAAPIGRSDRFTIVMGLDGAAEIAYPGGRAGLEMGQTVLLPAALGPCEIASSAGEATVLSCVVP